MTENPWKTLAPVWTVELPTRRSTLHLAQRLAPHLRHGDLVVLAGPLGAGKTFFVRGLARALGLPSTQPVTSPTFALIQELGTRPVSLIHADLYRLNRPQEVNDLGLLQARDEHCLIVEWGAIFTEALGGDALVLELTRAPRRAMFSATGTRAQQLLTSLRESPPQRGLESARP